MCALFMAGPLCEKGTKMPLLIHQHPVCLTAMQTGFWEIPTMSDNQRLVMVMGMQITVCVCVCAFACVSLCFMCMAKSCAVLEHTHFTR